MKVLVTGSAGFIGSALSIRPLQPCDVPDTYADVDDLVKEFGYKPSMSVKQGVENFAKWYKEYNNI
jgi:UDP-glucuronate 4-epimerase